MQLHQVSPIHKFKKSKRVGRGGKKGTYSGKGIKGQNSRSGRKFKPAIRELIKRYPKLRGYRFKSKIRNPKSEIVVVNLELLEKKFEAGAKISPEILAEKKIIARINSIMPKVKILGQGNVSKAFSVENCLVSKKAKERIEKAGGSIK